MAALLDTNVYPCKRCTLCKESENELEQMLQSLDMEVNDRSTSIMIGIYHGIMHLPLDDKLSVLWLQDNLIIHELKRMSINLVENYTVGGEMNRAIQTVIEKKWVHVFLYK